VLVKFLCHFNVGLGLDLVDVELTWSGYVGSCQSNPGILCNFCWKEMLTNTTCSWLCTASVDILKKKYSSCVTSFFTKLCWLYFINSYFSLLYTDRQHFCCLKARMVTSDDISISTVDSHVMVISNFMTCTFTKSPISVSHFWICIPCYICKA